MRPYHLLLLIFVVPAIRQAAAQSTGCVAYTAADGLATGNFQNFLQDRQGYLWVGSYAHGVSRFDGKTWKTWDTNNGLLQNMVVAINEDRAGGVWFCHGEHGFSRHYRDSLEQYPVHNDPSPFFDYFSQAYLLYDRTSSQLRRYEPSGKTFSATGERFLPDDLISRFENVTVAWQPQPGRYLLMARHKGGEKADLYFTTPRPVPEPEYRYTLPKSHIGTSMVMADDGSIVLFNETRKRFFLLQNQTLRPLPSPPLPGKARTQPTPIIATIWHADPLTRTLLLVWRLEEKTGGKPRYLLADYDLTNLRLRQTLLFSTSYKVAQCYKDRVGTYWVSTEATVMRLFPEHFFIPTDAPGMLPSTWSAAQAADGTMWFASYGFGLASFDGWQVQPSPLADRGAVYANGSLTDKRGNMYFNAEQIRIGNVLTKGLLKFNGAGYQLLAPGTVGFFLGYDRRGRLMRGMNRRGLWLLPPGKTGLDTTEWIKIDRSQGLGLENVLTALEDASGRYWMGRSSQGLACYDPVRNTVWNWLKSPDKPHYGVMSMDMDSHNNLWLGTDRGLCYLDQSVRVDSSFNPLQVLRRIALDQTGESTVTTLKVYDAHTLLFGNAQGFYLLDLDAFYDTPQRILLRTFNDKNGNALGGIEQNAVFVTREKQVWLMGAQGALRFDPALARRDTLRPVIRLDSLATDEKIFTRLTAPIRLGSGAQRVRLYFHHDLNPQLLDNIRFRYRLTGDSAWSALSTTPFAEFSQLAPGNYVFEVRAEKDGLLSVPAAVKFHIAHFWWQNPWCWLLALVVIISIGLYFRSKELKIAHQYIQLEKSKTAIAMMNKEKDRLQVQAIVNQLNPHFINNALQWLQVRVDQDEEAVRVVGKLSENIAVVFKNSRQKKSFHALSDEIKLAENYLYIQKCRFRERLQYEVPDETALQGIGAVNVPLMIIQIHVENAVEHGIRSKTDGVGSVQVAVRTDADYVTITVTDDGIGRQAARHIGSRGTQNGTLMLEELASIYNRQNALPIEQRYEDDILVTPEGKPYGTRVIIRIPHVYHFDL